MLTLKEWYLKGPLGCMFLCGRVFGHYKFEEGHRIRTSLVKQIYQPEEKKYIVETISGSIYQLSQENQNQAFLWETRKLLENADFAYDETLLERMEKKEEEFKRKTQRRKECMAEALKLAEETGKSQELYLIMERGGHKILKAFFRDETGRYDIEYDCILSEGWVADWKDRKVNLCYFVEDKVEIEEWPEGLKQLSVYNMDEEDMRLSLKGNEKTILCSGGSLTKISLSQLWVKSNETPMPCILRHHYKYILHGSFVKWMHTYRKRYGACTNHTENV